MWALICDERQHRQCRLSFSDFNFNHNPFQIRLFLTQQRDLPHQILQCPNGCADVVQNATVRLIFIQLKQAQIELLFSPVWTHATSRVLCSAHQHHLVKPVQARQSRLFQYLVPQWWNTLQTSVRAGGYTLEDNSSNSTCSPHSTYLSPAIVSFLSCSYPSPLPCSVDSCTCTRKLRTVIISVKINIHFSVLTIIIVVASALVLSHIRFNCFTGPIRNMVLYNRSAFNTFKYTLCSLHLCCNMCVCVF